MKQKILKTMILVWLSILMTSCYTYTYTVGEGSKSGETVTAKNHYFINGLAKGKQSDPKQMAGNSDDYKVTIQHKFVDGLLGFITFGIYTPTTTKVEK